PEAPASPATPEAPAVNVSPTISIITPTDQQVFEQGQVIEITTLSADEDGKVVKVDFYADDLLIASVEVEPFTFNWDNAPLGNHYITAIATDNEGAATVSTPVYITIEEAPAANVSPTISIITPTDQQVFEQGQVIEITTLSADEDGEVVKVDFFADDLLIASVEAEPFTFNWDNAPLGNHYITAIATDNEGAATVSTPIYITVEEAPEIPEAPETPATPEAPAVNVSPTISIITPEDQQVFEQGQVIEITALSADEDGEVVKVDFYAGDLLIASLEAEPFTFNWDNAPLGNHYITAIATDNEGAATVSTPVYITIEEAPAANVSPTISIITPEDQQVFEQGQVIEITTLSADEDGEVVKVDFYADDLLIASVEAEPFTFNWDNAPLGNHYITAIATDNEGAATVSNSVYITIEEAPEIPETPATPATPEAPAANVSPTISIINPEDQQVFEQGQVIEITTLSADEDGEVVKVDFYAGDLLIASVEAEPFTFNWDNAPLGNHYITAIATDNEGAATVSTPIFITIEEAPEIPEAPAANVSPTISIITPEDQQVFEQGQVIEITTLSADEDGEVVKVDFYAGDLLIASVEAEPFTFNWDNAPLGNHYITAIATDNEGAATVSTPIYITVEEAPAANVSPTISIITPTDQQVFEQGQVIEITTLSADEDGEVVKVDFYAGDLLIASVEAEPFTFNWDNAPLGNHYITAIATDNEGAATVSNSVHITVEEAPAVNVSPTISIITPEDQQVFEQGQVIEITTLSADEDGEVVKVDFYADDLLIASVEAEPFTFNWDNAP
ncbi:Ig-like domain-containing protein, partial [Belliella kenyensis]|uniref:Ig-like domain-containing protein n=1 Tax=Belliella kenyensis TaxID=1472724 RepID=UPI001F4B7A29